MTLPSAAVNAAARAHYAHTWATVHGDPEGAEARWDNGEVEPATMTYHQDHVTPLVHAALQVPIHDSPELSRTARALYIADHAQNPYAPTDWDRHTVTYDERRRYIGLARTTITTYQQEVTK